MRAVSPPQRGNAAAHATAASAYTMEAHQQRASAAGRRRGGNPSAFVVCNRCCDCTAESRLGDAVAAAVAAAAAFAAPGLWVGGPYCRAAAEHWAYPLGHGGQRPLQALKPLQPPESFGSLEPLQQQLSLQLSPTTQDDDWVETRFQIAIDSLPESEAQLKPRLEPARDP